MTRIADGRYSYNRVNTFGPATRTIVVIHDGTLFAHILGEGMDAQETPSRWLPEIQQPVLAELIWHLSRGLAVRIPEFDPEPTPPAAGIGKPTAYHLHIQLGKLRVADHYRWVSAVIGREVASLTALTHSEWCRVHEAIQAQPEVAA